MFTQVIVKRDHSHFGVNLASILNGASLTSSQIERLRSRHPKAARSSSIRQAFSLNATLMCIPQLNYRGGSISSDAKAPYDPFPNSIKGASVKYTN